MAGEINSRGGKAIALPLDTANMASFSHFADQVVQALQKEWKQERFDYLVNNAGIGQRALIKDTTEALFDQLVNVFRVLCP